MNFEILHLTGSSGFIGQQVRQRLMSKNYKVYNYDFYSPSKEILNPMILQDVVFANKEKKQVILHVGAIASTSPTVVGDLKSKNIDYTKQISKLAANMGIPFVFVSSAAVYGQDMRMTREENPLNYYGESKLIGEQELLNCYIEDISNLVIFRLFNVYGFDERKKDSMMSIPSRFILDSLKYQRINIWKLNASQIQSRDFVWVEDVVEILLQTLEIYPWKETIVDLGSGCSIPFVQIADMLGKIRSTSIDFVDFPSGIDPSKYQVFTQADLTKMSNLGISRKLTPIENVLEEVWEKYFEVM